jgi:hypothetical protein
LRQKLFIMVETNNYINELEPIFKNGSNGMITLEATVDTGFESVALDECREVFDSDTSSFKSRGRIFFVIQQNDFNKVGDYLFFK